MRVNLPANVARFVQATNASDLDRCVACFAADAVVGNEGRIHTGIDGIRDQKRETANLYTILEGAIAPLRIRP